MHRLSHFKQNEVGYVNHVAYRAQSAQSQPSFKPEGRGAYLYVLYVVRYIPRAQLGRGYCYFYISAVLYGGKGVIGLFKGLFKHGGNFAGYAKYALAVGPVRSNAYIEDVVVKPEYGFHVVAVFARRGEDKQSVVVCAIEHIAVYTQFCARAQHTVRFYAAQFALLYGHHALNRYVVLCRGVNGCALQRDGRLYALFNVVGSAANLEHALFAAVNLADVQVRALNRLALCNFAYVNARNVLAHFV